MQRKFLEELGLEKGIIDKIMNENDKEKHPVTDQEISEYKSVPISVAAEYLGITRLFLQNALEQRAVPFGCCAIFGSGQRRFDIRPQALIDYKHHGTKVVVARFSRFGRGVLRKM